MGYFAIIVQIIQGIDDVQSQRNFQLEVEEDEIVLKEIIQTAFDKILGENQIRLRVNDNAVEFRYKLGR